MNMVKSNIFKFFLLTGIFWFTIFDSRAAAATITAIDAPTEMQIGESIVPEYELSAAEDYDLLISSSDNTVIEVGENGTLKAIGKGTATIRVETSETATEYTIEVKDVAVESISFEEDILKLQAGEKKELSVTIWPAAAAEAEITYTSSNEQVAKCDRKQLVANETGRTLITATADSGASAELLVEVYEAETDASETAQSENVQEEAEAETEYIKAEQIVVKNEKDYINREIGIDEKIDFSVTVLPENTTYPDYEIISSNENIIKVENNEIKIVGIGNVGVTFQAHDGVFKTIELKIVDKKKINTIVLAAGASLLIIIILAVVQIVKRIKR